MGMAPRPASWPAEVALIQCDESAGAMLLHLYDSSRIYVNANRLDGCE
jgi:hypothetical protein